MMEFMEFFKPHMDLDDQILHYLIGGFGLVIGSLVKKGFDFSPPSSGIRSTSSSGNGGKTRRRAIMKTS